jgi:hypothetical protein
MQVVPVEYAIPTKKRGSAMSTLGRFGLCPIRSIDTMFVAELIIPGKINISHFKITLVRVCIPW